MNGSLLPAEAAAAPFTAAVRIEHRWMSPEIPKGSVAFLAPPGFDREGIYSLACPHDGRHHGDVRRACLARGGYLLKMDAGPPGGQVLTVAELRSIAPCRVVGLAVPYNAEFEEFLRARFAGGRRS